MDALAIKGLKPSCVVLSQNSDTFEHCIIVTMLYISSHWNRKKKITRQVAIKKESLDSVF